MQYAETVRPYAAETKAPELPVSRRRATDLQRSQSALMRQLQAYRSEYQQVMEAAREPHPEAEAGRHHRGRAGGVGPMRITIAVRGHFRNTSALGKDEMTVTIPDSGGLHIRDLLETLNLLEEEVGQVTVNGRPGRLGEGVRHRMRLEFFPRERSK